MSQQMEIPDGYIVVKKGGRPKSTLRDLAVFIAYQLKKDELGKGYLANEWIIENFKLNDYGHVRKCRSNARNILTKRWFATTFHRGMFLFPAKATPEEYATVETGTVGWAWAEGCPPAALELKVTSGFSIPGPKANPDSNVFPYKWEIQPGDKW